MSRPRKDGMEYFPHDSYAVNDKKIEALRMLYDNDGYAFYFILLETIYKEPNYELDVSDAETIQILVRKVAVTEDKFNLMLATALKRGCFDAEAYESKRVLTSNGIKKRALMVTDKRVRMQESYATKGIKVSAPVSAAETIAGTPQSKDKVKGKVRDKEVKIKYAEFVSLFPEEYEKLIKQYGEDMTQECIDILNTYKGSTGKTYKSDYMTMTPKAWVPKRYLEDQEKKLGHSFKPTNKMQPNHAVQTITDAERKVLEDAASKQAERNRHATRTHH